MDFPLNIYSIEDVAAWRKVFFWPLSAKELYSIELAAHEGLLATIRPLPPRSRRALRVASGWLATQITDWAASVITAARLAERHDVRPVFTNARKPAEVRVQTTHCVKAIMDGALPRFDYFTPFCKGEGLRRASTAYLRLRQFASRCKQQYQHSPRGFLSDRLLCFNPNLDTLAYVRHTGEPFRVLPPAVLFPSMTAAKVDDHAVPLSCFADAAWGVAAIVDNCTEKTTGLRPDERLREFFAASVLRLMKMIDLDLEAVSRRRNLLAGKEILTGTGGNYFTRVMSQVAREAGAHVTGFPHGGASSSIHWPKFALSELEMFDTFVVYDPLEASVMLQYETIDNRPDFKLVTSSYPSLLRTNPGKVKPSLDVAAIKTVMYVPPGFFGDRQGAQLMPELVHFDLELRLIEFFLDMGVRVIYKNRAKTLSSGSGFTLLDYFKDRDVVFEDRPFSHPDVLASADIFVFSKAASTALWEAMYMTDKPVVLFHPDIPKLTEPFLAQDRIHFVKIAQDERNRFLFDENDFWGQVTR